MSDYTPDSPLAALARHLVDAFGDGWSVDTERSYAHGIMLDGPDVRVFMRDVNYVGNDQPPTRLVFTGATPRSVPVHDQNSEAVGFEWGEVGVSAGRSVEEIRKEVERRLLPTARQAHAGVLDRIAKRATDRKARHVVRDNLAALLPDAHVGREDDRATSSEITTYAATGANYVRSDWWLNHDGTRVNVELKELTPAQARQIAVLLYRKAT